MLDALKNNFRYLTTTKIGLRHMNQMVKLVEETLDVGEGSVVIDISRKKIRKIRLVQDYYTNLEDAEEDNESDKT